MSCPQSLFDCCDHHAQQSWWPQKWQWCEDTESNWYCSVTSFFNISSNWVMNPTVKTLSWTWFHLFSASSLSSRPPRTEVKADPDDSADEEQERDEPWNEPGHLANKAVVSERHPTPWENTKSQNALWHFPVGGVFLSVCSVFLVRKWLWRN